MQIEEFLGRLDGVKKNGIGWTAKCPSHQDRQNSLSVGDGDKGIVLKCFAGCEAGDIVGAMGLAMKDLFPNEEKSSSYYPPNTRARAHGSSNRENAASAASSHGLQVVSNQITLADYADAKKLPVEFLSDLGLKDRKRDGKVAVAIPYLDANGKSVATRYRIAMAGDRFRWNSGAKPQLYGLWRLEDARKADQVVIVEGESDCHAAWFHGLPAVGLPGAANWRDDRDAQRLDGVNTIYIVLEPDSGGEAVLKWLSKSAIKERVHLIDLGKHKDLSELHLGAGDQFDRAWKAAVEAAVPFLQLEAKTAEAEHRQALDACGHLIEKSRHPDQVLRGHCCRWRCG